MVTQGTVRQGKRGSGLVQDEVWGRFALPAVAVGVLAVSAAAIFIRLADAPAIAIAFWRCALGAALLLPPALVRQERFPKGRDLYVGVASGVALGAHFGFWISSLDHTSVAASVVLVSTQPVFVAILAYLTALLRRHPRCPGGHRGHRGRRFGGLGGSSGQRTRARRGGNDRDLRPDRTLVANRRDRGPALLGGGLFRRRARALAGGTSIRSPTLGVLR